MAAVAASLSRSQSAAPPFALFFVVSPVAVPPLAVEPSAGADFAGARLPPDWAPSRPATAPPVPTEPPLTLLMLSNICFSV